MGIPGRLFRVATAAYSFKNSVKTFNSIRTMVWVTKDDGVVSSILPKSDVSAEQRKATKSTTTVDYLSGLDILSPGAPVRLSGIVGPNDRCWHERGSNEFFSWKLRIPWRHHC